MGVDLTLLPFDGEISADYAFSHTILPCSRDYRIWEAISGLATQPVPKGFQTYLSRDDKYEEPHYGETQETPYGEPLLCTTVRDLLSVRGLINPASQKSRAAWAYLAELPPDTRVALYWH